MMQTIKLIEDIKGDKYIIFKDSKGCGIASFAHEQVEMFLKDNPDILFYHFYVQDGQKLKIEIQDKYNIQHQSPQLIIIDNKTNKKEVLNHYNITVEKIKEKLK